MTDKLNDKGQLELALSSEGLHDLETIRRETKLMLTNEAYGKTVERVTNDYLKQRGASVVSKTIGGTVLGGSAGLVTHLLGASNPITAGVFVSAETLHFLYSHPDIGVRVLRTAKAIVPALPQAVRATHFFDPQNGLQENPDHPANQ